MEIKDILKKLHGVVRTTNGWQALCPAHSDEKPSLCIANDDGKILLHCKAGCRTEDVVKALGLEMRDLFPENQEHVKRTVIATYPHQDENGDRGIKSSVSSPKGSPHGDLMGTVVGFTI